MSKTRLLVHIVFATKRRAKTLPLQHKRRLYAYMHGIIENHMCTTLRINGTSDHVHVLIDLHPSVALADLVKELKQSSSLWLKDKEEFRGFQGWGTGYYAASIGHEAEKTCINYIKNQESHHGTKDFMEEVRDLSMQYMLGWDERDWQ